MQAICNTYSVFWGNTTVGTLQVTREGSLFLFACQCTPPSTAVLRLWAVGTGSPVSLGIPIPDGTLLTFRKRFSAATLQAMGLTSIRRCFLSDTAEPPVWIQPDTNAEMALETQCQAEIEVKTETEIETETEPTLKFQTDTLPTDTTWQPVINPAIYFQDATLANACATVRGAIRKEMETFSYLGIPLQQDAPFPMLPVFQFGDLQTIDGQDYLVFQIKDGYLY